MDDQSIRDLESRILGKLDEMLAMLEQKIEATAEVIEAKHRGQRPKGKRRLKSRAGAAALAANGAEVTNMASARAAAQLKRWGLSK